MACTSGTVSSGAQPAALATRLEAPSPPTTVSGVNFFRASVGGALDFEHESSAIRVQGMEAAAQLERSAGPLRFFRESLNQARGAR